MKKWILVGLAVVVLIAGGVFFATRSQGEIQNTPTAPEVSSTPEQKQAPEEKVATEEPEATAKEEAASPQPTPSPVKEISNEATDSSVVRVSAKDLFSDFQENSVAATSKYNGKILEVTGEIAEIGNSALGDYIRLIGDKAKAGYGGITFYGISEEKEKVVLLKKGQTVTIRGELSLGLKASSFVIPLMLDSIIE